MSAGRLLVLFLVALPAWADDRIASIRSAAAEVRDLDIVQAQEAVLGCYQARKPYETCVAQDFIVSNIAARGARDPLGVLEEMAERITQTMAYNNVPLADAQEFILLVKEHGFR